MYIENPKALLNMMNTNIKTMRRVRHTHAKFAALNATTLAHEEVVEEGASLVSGGIGSVPLVVSPSSGDADALDPITSTVNTGEAINAAVDDEILNEKLDERPFVIMQKVKGRGEGRERRENGWQGWVVWISARRMLGVACNGLIRRFWNTLAFKVCTLLIYQVIIFDWT